MHNIVSFVEETCFSGETFRTVRRQIFFTVNMFALNFREDMIADNGLWYDFTDEYLVGHLQANFPDLEWGRFIYHKKIDYSSVEITNPDTGRRIGSIYVRRGSKPNLSREILGANVITWDQVQSWRNERDRRTEDITEE